MPSARVACGSPKTESVIAGSHAWRGPSHADTYLNRTEDPKDERLHNDKSSRSYSESEVDANILSHVGITAVPLIDL
jgi:hypothetical protein